MKKFFILVITCLFLHPALAETVSLPGTDISFVPPQGFKTLSKKAVDNKWADNKPKYVISSKTGATTVSYDYRPQPFAQEKLPELLKTTTKMFDEGMPGIIWKNNKITRHAGLDWMLLEMTSNTPGVNLHSITLITIHKGKMITFNFNSTPQEFAIYEDMLRKSINSIRVGGQQ